MTTLKGDGEMRHTLLRGMLVSTFLLLLVSVSPGVAASPTDDVRESLTGLREWLATDRNGAGWHKFLQSDDLAAQLEKGAGADPQILSEIQSKYTSGQAGLSKSRFVAVRTALNSWLMDLKYGDPEQLKAAIAEAKGRFKPIEEGAVS